MQPEFTYGRWAGRLHQSRDFLAKRRHRASLWGLPGWVLAIAMLLAACSPTPANPPTAQTAAIACWGDSLTYSAVPDGQASPTWPQTLSTELGVTVFNGGVSGNGSAEIATRQGGLTPLISLPANEVPPGSTAAIPVTAISPTTGWRIGEGSGSLTMKGSLAGVAGTLRHVLQNDSFTFTPANEHFSAVAVPPRTPFVSNTGGSAREQIVIIWAGTNNISDPAAIERDIASMVSSLAPDTERYLVVSNTQTKNMADPLNSALSNTYKDRYANLRDYLMTDGLEAAGITPTHTDTADIAAGNVPSSLKWDKTHFTQAGYTVIGRYFAELVASRNWT